MLLLGEWTWSGSSGSPARLVPRSGFQGLYFLFEGFESVSLILQGHICVDELNLQVCDLVVGVTELGLEDLVVDLLGLVGGCGWLSVDDTSPMRPDLLRLYDSHTGAAGLPQ